MDELTKRVKEELERYPDNRRRYYEMMEEILYSTVRPDADSRNQSYAPDTTGAKATKLAELDNKPWVRWMRLIESTLDQMRNYDRELVRLRYFEGYRPNEVATEMYISREKFFRDIDRIIFAIQMAAIKEGLLEKTKSVHSI